MKINRNICQRKIVFVPRETHSVAYSETCVKNILIIVLLNKLHNSKPPNLLIASIASTIVILKCDDRDRRLSRERIAHASFRAVHHSKVGPEENACVCVRLRERASEKALGEGERSRARMRNVTHVNNAYRSPRASLPESRSFGSQPTYYLFIRTVPGWSAT